jgi:hypothetical protein
MTWKAVSNRPVSVWPMVLVMLPSIAMPKGTLATTLTADPPVLSTMPTVTRGTIRIENTSSTVASHFQPCSLSGRERVGDQRGDEAAEGHGRDGGA